MLAQLEPPVKMGTTVWAKDRRKLSAKGSALPGDYNPDITPWVAGIHDALDDPAVVEVSCAKSAQVAWTDGVILNYLGKRIDVDPAPMIVMFAKEKSAQEFNAEKFEPMVEATVVLQKKLPPKSKARWEFKDFPGGFLKFVGSNSPASVKSTPAPVVCVEEPDDCNENVREQGDTITLLKERTKTFPRRKVIFGGTPTIEGVSRIWASYLAGDQRKFWVPCPHCGEEQVLAWEQVRWVERDVPPHEIFGRIDLASARYHCPHCDALWTDAEKNRAVRRGVWRASAQFQGMASFYINELYSPFPGSVMSELLKKRLIAEHALALGDDTKMRSFRNNTEGLPYAYKSDLPDGDDLKLRAEDYAEFTVPAGGLLMTAGVDVQHDRLAIIIRAWGRGEESWLVYWGEIYGSTLQPKAGAWLDLDALLTREYRHASGAVLRINAVSIDGSDGNRTEIVHAFVRPRRGHRYMAIKGAAEASDDKKEIFSTPRRVDPGKAGKMAKKGLETYIVGTARAKDLILDTRLKIEKAGAGCLHWYRGVRPDYWEQLTSEVKAPSRINRNRLTWQKKAGVRNEALDCEVYALHAARRLKTNLMQPGHWDAIEARLRQRSLIAEPEQEEAPVDLSDDDETPEALDQERAEQEQADEGRADQVQPEQVRAAGPPASSDPPELLEQQDNEPAESHDDAGFLTPAPAAPRVVRRKVRKSGPRGGGGFSARSWG
ncbi:phage terminase large subunit family protein [Zoogloea oryzae]|uniref:phage terminase large subunit family protein n=1 Tax=Zoogloea oryzae TaxID=310767 RepID=UPI0024E08FB8|nr:terminase gpA endonuclease subunit [Zoogloea oryzae]